MHRKAQEFYKTIFHLHPSSGENCEWSESHKVFGASYSYSLSTMRESFHSSLPSYHMPNVFSYDLYLHDVLLSFCIVQILFLMDNKFLLYFSHI